MKFWSFWLIMSFTIEQRAKTVKSYLKTKILLQTQREYRKHFGVKQAPSSTAIKKIAKSLKCMALATTEIKKFLEKVCLLTPT